MTIRWLMGTLLVVAGCTPRSADPAGLRHPDVAEQLGQARCGVSKSAEKPLVVEWPAAERGALEARASRGLVAVRYAGCEMEVLSHCEVPGRYEYVGLTAKHESVRIRNVDELYARLPLGAAALEAQLERAGELRVDLEVVGRKESSVYEVSRHDLRGRCDEATHFVSGLTVGAFAMVAGEQLGGSGSVSAAGVGAGAGRSVSREVLREDGSPEACATASGSDPEPPSGCAALLRVEVLPLSEAPLTRDDPPPREPAAIEPSPSTAAGQWPAIEPASLGSLELDPSTIATLDPATLGSTLPEPATPGSGVICDAIDLQVLEIRRKGPHPPFHAKAMDAVELRVVNDNDVEVEVEGGEAVSFLDGERAKLSAMTPLEWFHPLSLPPHSSKVVEVLLPRREGPRLQSIETQANPASDFWAKCRVIDDRLAPEAAPTP
ncbi:MAG: hypothetical protein H6712_12635 [Myxococcales bacterium]|nr:hypothetical protein [Myxococcales bacterium]MCB9714704.1 hypothetical protein [Myxococcales bacterium]